MIVKVGRYWINTDAIAYIEESNHDEIAIHLLNGLPSGAYVSLKGESRSKFLHGITRLNGFYDADHA